MTTAASTAARLTDESLSDIQGFVTSGYGHLRSSAYLFVCIHEPAGGRQWLRSIAPSLSSSRGWPMGDDGVKIKPALAVNVAFTASGLRACGVPAETLCTFPPEFQEGMTAAQRSRLLGDTGDSAPSTWELGGPGREFHALVLLHAADDESIVRLCVEQRRRIEETGGAVTELAASLQRGYRPSTDREHFGFHDGIAQPSIAGVAGHGVPTGEFILGYENHYGVIPPPPVVSADLDPEGLLPALTNPYHAHLGLRDLGRHGSFVVYRKLRQHVAAFWTFMKAEAMRTGHGADPAYMVWLASKCIGRWPSGASMLLAPQRDDPRLAERDDFLYREDADGLACPLGAHVRRANPRDDLKPYASEPSLHMTEAHRLLRRGRVFGPPLFDPLALSDPSVPASGGAPLDVSDDGQVRGVHFFCVNASIRSQFEFVQQTWCNNPRFGGLRDNTDPIVGDHGAERPASFMTIPGHSGPERTAVLPRFVTVCGGAYPFMPSLSALRYLARK